MWKKIKNWLIALVFGTAVLAAGSQIDFGDNIDIVKNISIDGNEKEIKYTDDNTNEDFIIMTDEKDYYSFGGNIISYFSVTNISNSDEEIEIVFSLGNGQNILSLEKYIRNDDVVKDGKSVEKTIWDNIQRVDKKSKYSEKQKSTKNKPIKGVYYDKIKSNETIYYQATIEVLHSMKNGEEWFIEVFSDDKYGHLDPNNWIYEQKFDGLNDGTIDGQDGWTSGTPAHFNVLTGDAYEGTKCLQITTGDTGDSFNAYRALTSISSGIFYFSIKIDSISESASSIVWGTIRDSSNNRAIQFSIDQHDGIFRAYKGLSNSPLFTLDVDTYVRVGFEFDVSTQKWRFNTDNGSFSDWYDFYATTSSLTEFLLARNSSFTTNVYIDYISPNYEEAVSTDALMFNMDF